MTKPRVLLLGEIEQYVCLFATLIGLLCLQKCREGLLRSLIIFFAMSCSAKEEWASLSSLADIVEPRSRSRAEFIEECKSGVFENVVVAFRTFASVDITGLVDEELVAVLPRSLKFITHNGMLGFVLGSGRYLGKESLEI